MQKASFVENLTIGEPMLVFLASAMALTFLASLKENHKFSQALKFLKTPSFKAQSLLATDESEASKKNIFTHSILLRTLVSFLEALCIFGGYFLALEYFANSERSPIVFGCLIGVSTLLAYRKPFLRKIRRYKLPKALKDHEIVFLEDMMGLFNGTVVIIENFNPASYWNRTTSFSSTYNIEIEPSSGWKYIELPYSSITRLWVSQGNINDLKRGITSVIDVIVVGKEDAFRIGRGYSTNEKFISRLEVIVGIFKQHSVEVQMENLASR